MYVLIVEQYNNKISVCVFLVSRQIVSVATCLWLNSFVVIAHVHPAKKLHCLCDVCTRSSPLRSTEVNLLLLELSLTEWADVGEPSSRRFGFLLSWFRTFRKGVCSGVELERTRKNRCS